MLGRYDHDLAGVGRNGRAANLHLREEPRPIWPAPWMCRAMKRRVRARAHNVALWYVSHQTGQAAPFRPGSLYGRCASLYIAGKQMFPSGNPTVPRTVSQTMATLARGSVRPRR